MQSERRSCIVTEIDFSEAEFEPRERKIGSNSNLELQFLLTGEEYRLQGGHSGFQRVAPRTNLEFFIIETGKK